MNLAIIYGNLTRDPELKSLPSGNAVANLGIATNYRTQRDGQWVDVPEFHNVVVFGKTAENVAQYMKKGSPLLVEGRIQTRSWDSPDKGKQYRTEIIASRVEFGPRGSGSASSGAVAPSVAQGGYDAPAPKSAPKEDTIAYPEEDINPDDIPF